MASLRTIAWTTLLGFAPAAAFFAAILIAFSG